MPKPVFTDEHRRLVKLLIRMRGDMGVTQAELARRLGKPQSYVSKIERLERRQEILNLRFGNFAELEDGKERVLIEHSKAGEPRWISCTLEMIAIRDRMQQIRRAEGDDRLFPVSLTTAKRKLTKLWKACGLEDVRLHDLRRTHATQLVNNGIDLRTVATRLGHRDLSMLEKHYVASLGDAGAALKAQEVFGKIK